MKRILILLCLIFILPTPLFAYDEIKLSKVQFFAGGYDPPEESQRQYTNHFPKSTTRYVWCQLEVENLLHQVRHQKRKVVWRYYKPDGTLHGEVDADFDIKPEWKSSWIPRGWGWDEPGNWDAGTYRVEIWVDGKKFAQDLFTVFDDTSPQTAPATKNLAEQTYLEFEFVKFFESGKTAPPESERQYNTRFSKKTTRYVFFLAGAKNLLYKNRVHKPHVVGLYFNPDGTLRGEADVDVDIPADWENADIWSGWGWDQPDNWLVGTYRVEIWFGKTKAGEGSFTIY